MAGSYGTLAQFELNDVQYDFHPSSMIGVREEHVNTTGIRGHPDEVIERNLPGIKRVNGQIRFFPTPTELTTLLPIIYGTAASGTTYALATTLTGYAAVADRVTKVHTYAGAKAVRSRFHGGGHNTAVGLDVDFLGTTETEGAAGTFTSTGISVATKPWMFHQATVTVDGNTVTPQSWEFTVDWNADAERFYNSQTLAEVNTTFRTITMNMMLPYDTSPGASIYTSSLLNTGVQVVITATNGVNVLTFTFVKVAFQKNAPELSRGEVMLPLVGQAFRSSSTLPIVTTLALT